MLKITYMAKFREQLATSDEMIEWQGGNADELITLLRSRSALWAEVLSPQKIYKIAVNESIVHGNPFIPADARVALLPPVTGG